MATLGICLVLVVIVGLIGVLLTHIINRPLDKLGNAIRQVDEQGDYKITEEFGEDEIGQIGRRFKRMVEQNLALKDSLYETGMRQKEAQLQALQAQINPHFLYNTLDCISWKAMANDQTEIAEMIQCLSKMFRFSLGRGEKEIELSKEVENTRNYLLLQKKRFEDKLVYLIDIPESVMKYRVIKFFLQPLVENSILHGIQSKPEKGYIGISAEEEDRELVICVWDNGTGIDEKQVAVLLDGNTYDNSGKRHRHGIYNVNERLKMRYGEDSALRFENRKNGGTKVTIRIPVDKLRQDD